MTKKRKMDINPLGRKALQAMVREHLNTPSAIVKMAKIAAGMK